MIDIARVNVCAVVKQVPGDLDGGSKVQRCLPIASPRMHQRRIAFDQFFHPLEPTQARRRMNINISPAFDEVRRKLLDWSYRARQNHPPTTCFAR